MGPNLINGFHERECPKCKGRNVGAVSDYCLDCGHDCAGGMFFEMAAIAVGVTVFAALFLLRG